MFNDRIIRLDPTNISITFAVRWLGVLIVRGRFAEIEGSIRIPNESAEDYEIAVDVMAASIRTGISLRDRHLRGPQFFDVARHPTISFRSTRVERPNGIIVVRGTLRLRGHERAVCAICQVPSEDRDVARTNSGLGGSAFINVRIDFVVPRLPHAVGVARGIHRLNPLLSAIGANVSVRAGVLVPSGVLLPTLIPTVER